MDLVQVDRREELFGIMINRLQEHSSPYGFQLTGFPTSIWDESLYKAWSSIVCSLIPNMNTYEKHLSKLTGLLEAQEIILFEKTTFLVICSSNKPDLRAPNGFEDNRLDPKRFEKISNIMKNFKQSATKLKSQFKTLILNDSLFIVELSSNLMVFVVLEKGKFGQQVILENIKQARKYFQ